MRWLHLFWAVLPITAALAPGCMCSSPGSLWHQTNSGSTSSGTGSKSPTSSVSSSPDGNVTYSPTQSVVCKHAGDGPPLPFDGAYSGRFPIKPILELYKDTACRTISPSYIRDLVTNLSSIARPTTDAPVGDFAGAVEDVVGLSESLGRLLLGVGTGADYNALLRDRLALYARAFSDDVAKQQWESWLKSGGYGSVFATGAAALLPSLIISWGEAETAAALGITAGELSGVIIDDDALYQQVLGVSRDEALGLLESYKLSADDTLDRFLSVVHVSKSIEGRRWAYLFAVGDDLTPVQGLHAGDFTVTVDGAPVPTADLKVATLVDLAHSDASTVRFAISFVLDYSGSMSAKDKGFLEDALLYFIETLPPVYLASVHKFSSDVQTYQPLTRDTEKLKAAITRKMSAGSTSLYDAVGAGIGELSRSDVPFRLQLVFTDGMENASRTHCHQSVVALSKQNGIPVFVMGMGQIDVPAMLTLTNDTNACFLYAPSNDKIKEIYQVIGTVMAKTYVLSWPVQKNAPQTVKITANVPDGAVGDEYRMSTP